MTDVELGGAHRAGADVESDDELCHVSAPLR